MKIIMFFDQIQSGFGTKDDKMVPLSGSKDLLGPSIILSPLLKEVDGKIVACIYCGNGTYLENPDEISRKICEKIDKLNPDLVICGPAFDFKDYSQMCARICHDINTKTKVKSIAAMSKENEDVINEYKDKILIVETPKKGGVGLNECLKNIVKVAKAVYDSENLNSVKEQFCFN